ncbi:rhombosortase [Syntrophotalea acetylenivorans]|uniref:Rhombosortase n=1 Tax=Syntrophotalea acetylenivorans TaxID=1842532 RepID=A0A1L3GQ79_9BACT|nr:rhombosortase [Syntrophotalea acetylenivorans]APG28106.1 rhombosortase [Syntrophotalea acetylenivorans]
MKFRLPLLTCLLVGASLLATLCPFLTDALVYDRQAVLGGDWWRLFTAPLVHFSGSHLGWNLLVFGVAGWAVEAAEYRFFWLVCALACGLPGPIYLLIAPELARYGGLSGVATAAVVFFCACSLFKLPKNRRIWLAILVLTGVKIAVEAVGGASVFVHSNEVSFRVLPSVHVVGYLGAIAVAFVCQACSRAWGCIS